MSDKKSSQGNSFTSSPVVIFGDNITAWGVIRGLRDSKIPIYMVSDAGNGAWTRSKYVIDVLVLPPSDPNYVDKVLDWVVTRIEGKPTLMIAGNDDALEVLSKQHDKLSEFTRPTFPPWNVVRSVINKDETYKKACDLGLPTIKSKKISTLDELRTALLKISEANAYPIFLKCSDSRRFFSKFGTKGVICNNEREVVEAYDKYDSFLGALLLQEFLPGDIDNILAVLLVLNKRSEVVAVTVNEKIRSATLYGTTCLSASIWDARLVERAVTLVETIGYIGTVGVQFKFDSRSHEYKVLEINGRFSVSASLAHRCGVNMAKIVYEEFNGIELPRLLKFQCNYRHKILLWYPFSDLALLTQTRFYKNPIHYIASLIGSGYIIEPFSWRDPKPFMIVLGRAFKDLLKRVTSILRFKKSR